MHYPDPKSLNGIANSGDIYKNCITGPVVTDHTWPWQTTPGIDYRPPTTTTQIILPPIEDKPDMEITKVENGFIVDYQDKEYVFETTESLNNFITEKFNGTKS